MYNWISVKDRLPIEYEVVLTQHIDDLYPVSAYWITINTDDGIRWLREVEGPEDIIISGSGKHFKLTRNPTHWQPLPPPPKG